jgi:segregation and condensation protein A
MEYEVRLEIFQGPMDLLLHLIRKNEVDIFDIPIATITDQYLEYIDMMKALNVSLAGDFLVMASTLLHIKSKMLLPETQEEEEEDPRAEITRPLIEYLRLKELAGDLSEREMLGRDVFARRLPQDIGQYQTGEALLSVSLFQLIDAFKRILDLNLPGMRLTFKADKWSVKDRTTYIMERLKEQWALFFSELFSGDKTLSEFVVTFLALLELVQMGLVRAFQSDPMRDIKVEARFDDEEEVEHA